MLGFFYVMNFDHLLIFPIVACSLGLILPTLYLFFEYYYFSKGQTVTIDDTAIILEKHGSKESFPIKDISKVTIYKSATMEKRKWNFPLTSIELFYYVRIATRSGKEIILTCLLQPGFDESLKHLEGVPTVVNRGFFLSILYP
jgi:hypothetical protein